jgi:hypothetical protein
MNGIRGITSLFNFNNNNRGLFGNTRNKRNTMMFSLLALGIGATVYGMTRGRNNRGILRQAAVQPIINRFNSRV